jgi:DNA-binding GntR family transcriptional regulator
MQKRNSVRSEGHESSPLDCSLSERAYLTIRDWILRNKLPLGTPLSRRQLSAELNMSLLPVSEALQRLEAEGLVESKARAGTRVKVPSRQDIWEHYVLREALECQAVRLFAQSATHEQRLGLRRMAEHLDALFNQSWTGTFSPESLFAVHDYHVSFHMRIAESTRCQILCNAIEKSHVLVFNWIFDVAGRNQPLPETFHRDLVDGVAGTDPDVAERAMRNHISYGLEQIIKSLEPRSLTEWRAPRATGH